MTLQFRFKAALTGMVVNIATLPAAISVASLTLHRSFILARERFRHTESLAARIYTSQVIEIQKIIHSVNQDHPGARIGLLSNFGSILFSLLNILSHLPIHNVADLRVVKRTILSGMLQQLDRDQNELIISLDKDKESIEALDTGKSEI